MKVLNTILVLIFAALIALILLQRLNKPKHEEEEPMEAKITVIDADTEEPIKGVRLKIQTTDPSCEDFSIVTNSNGECTFEYNDPEAVITLLTATKAGYERKEITDYELSEFEDEDLVIRLKKQDVIDRGNQIGGSGKLKITLMWDDPAVDLDLHVEEPNGFVIWYEGGRDGQMVDTATGGELDVDWQPNINSPDSIGENCMWADPPKGTYKAWVTCYGPDTAPPTECTVIVYQEGEDPKRITLTIEGKDDRQDIPAIEVR